MNTNTIKSFAKKARLLLIEGVKQRLTYWGFEKDGSNHQALEATHGGYIFRGEVFNDPGVPPKWEALKKRISDKQALLDVCEDAAYTWFNRLMAIKILEENGYIPARLKYEGELHTPALVQNARRGKHELKKQTDKELLLEYLREDKDEQAFGLLLTDLCNSNPTLHDIFGRIGDYTEILLPQNLLQSDGLMDLINSSAIAPNDYREVELIGWLYQFYISDKKDEVFAGFKKNKKARAEDIPAATQIFTPKWIVKYMVENTVGKIYLDYEPDSSLREKMKYLVETVSSPQFTVGSRQFTVGSPQFTVGSRQSAVHSPQLAVGSSQLAVGSPQSGNNNRQASFFQEAEQQRTLSLPKGTPLITDLTQLTLLDPACGSGHILVTGFDLLFLMYREEGYTAKQAVNSILENNLYGLDIDDRAAQLACFAVMLKAAQHHPEILTAAMSVGTSPLQGGLRGVAKRGVNIHAFPEAAHFSAEELRAFLGSAGQNHIAELREALQLLNQGKNIGSALKLELSPEARTIVTAQYQRWMQLSQTAGLDIEQAGIWEKLKPFLDVLLLLTRHYTAVVANPPYMGQKSMNADLKKYVNAHYPISKSDLFAVFMEVCLNLNITKGLMGMINQHSWMFLSSYEKLRKEIVGNYSILNMLHLGPRTFAELSGEVVQSTAFVLRNGRAENYGIYYRLVDYRNIVEKENNFLQGNNQHPNIPQSNFSKIPGSPIAFWVSEKVINAFRLSKTFEEIGKPRQGLGTTDNNRFLRQWTEVSKNLIYYSPPNRKSAISSNKKWFSYTKGVGFKKWYGNNETVINWENDGNEVKRALIGRNPNIARSESLYFKLGITWGLISSGYFSSRKVIKRGIFDVGGSMSFPEPEMQEFLIGFLNSKLSSIFLKIINPTMNYQVGDIKRLPIKYKFNNTINTNSINCFRISRLDWDAHESSWDFEQSPLLNRSASIEQSYNNWQENVTADFFQLHANEEELNRIFIDIYGLQDELTPEVALKDITILQEELDRNELEKLEPAFREKGKEAIALPIKKEEVLGQFLSYAIGIFMGRYRIGKPGLNIAHPNPSEEELASYTIPAMSVGTSPLQGGLRGVEIDDDAILPIMGSNCAFPDDALVRIKDLVLAIWGEKSLTENINFLHEFLGMDLHKWLNEKFWSYHTHMYKKKPIYWLFSSNVKRPQNAAFKVLVYMHRMDKYTVQKIQRNYLHPHQEHIRREIEKLRENEELLGKQEQKRLELLRNWELECRDYNEVLKPLANLQIEIDLDDGVSVNYAKFEGAVAVI